MKRLLPLVLSLFLFSTPALSCLDEDVTQSADAGGAFAKTLRAFDNDTFLKSYCALSEDDQTFALLLFGSAYGDYEGDDRATLARLSIMIPDIRENVAFVAKHGEIREVDDEWESIGLLRIVEHMQARFPQTKSVLTDAYVKQTETLFAAALKAVASREGQSDTKIIEARQAIAEHERQIRDLMDHIQSLRDELRKYRTMRHELELQVR
nr:hypothetical protein [uncultured Cohaesibacter sp.]